MQTEIGRVCTPTVKSTENAVLAPLPKTAGRSAVSSLDSLHWLTGVEQPFPTISYTNEVSPAVLHLRGKVLVAVIEMAARLVVGRAFAQSRLPTSVRCARSSLSPVSRRRASTSSKGGAAGEGPKQTIEGTSSPPGSKVSIADCFTEKKQVREYAYECIYMWVNCCQSFFAGPVHAMCTRCSR